MKKNLPISADVDKDKNLKITEYFSSHIWDMKPPPPSLLGDHDVSKVSEKLNGRSIALMVCGGIAAMRAPILARALRKAGAQVTAFVSKEALRYVTLDTLSWSCNRSVVTELSARAEHLGDGAIYDAYLVAPATYNTVNKFASGIADGLITTTLSSALGLSEQGRCKILIVPTMHGSMHNSILTHSLHRLAEYGVHIVKPRLDYGKNNIPSESTLVNEVARALSTSPLKGKGILITGGPTPVCVDGVRRLTNKFTGRLSLKILEILFCRGAEARLVLGHGSDQPPPELAHLVEWVPDYEHYRERVIQLSTLPTCWAGIFTAAVADYTPKTQTLGKIDSGQSELTLSLTPTKKVIDEVKTQAKHLKMVTFKYQEDVSHEQLMSIAQQRLNRFDAVVANRGEDQSQSGDQVAWLCSDGVDPQRLVSKEGIAKGIADFLEHKQS